MAFGNAIGVDLGSGQAVSVLASIGVEPYVGWTQKSGFPNVSATNLDDHTGTATTCDLVTATMRGNRTTRAVDDSSALFDMFARGVAVDDTAGSTIDLSEIPYSEYDVIVYFAEDTGNSSGDSFSVTDGTTTYYYENQGTDNFDSGTLTQVTSTSSGSPDTTGNYVRFSGLTATAVTITGVCGADSATDFVGFQVIEVTGGGGGGIVPFRRRIEGTK